MPKRKPIPKYIRPSVAPAEATGGAGIKFENDIQALFATLMACDGEFNVFPNCRIESLQFQVFSKGYCTDDVLVRFVDGGNKERILLGQIKRTIRLTPSNREFTDTVQAAWIDYQNGKLFRKGRDAIALITGPLCDKDNDKLGWLFNQAHCLSMTAFFEKMREGRGVSKEHRKGFDLVCEILGVQNDGQVNEEQLYGFLRSFYVFQSDMWYEDGVVSSFADSLLKQHFPKATPRILFNEIVAQVRSRNTSGGDLSRKELVDAIQTNYQAVLQAEPIETKAETNAQAAQIKIALPLMEERANLHNHHLALLALIGMWQEDKQEDRHLVRDILQVDEAQLESFQQELIDLKQPMMIAEGGLIRVLRRRSVWTATANKISTAMVERFLDAAKEQLSKVDHRLDVEPDRRFYSDAKPGFGISESMRKGLAEGLAILGVDSDCCDRASVTVRSQWAATAVAACLQNSSWKTWATLDDLLPYMAEAAPEKYLANVNQFLDKRHGGIDILFAQERPVFMGRTYIGGFLNALQHLAWLPEFFASVLDILARLVKLDPGGQWNPRPAEVMQRILYPSCAHTTVDPMMRLDVFSALLKKYPEPLWDVLVSLLPSEGCFYVKNANEPVYRRPENMKKDGENVSMTEATEQFDRYETMAVEWCGTNPNRIIRLIDSAVEYWSEAPFETLAKHLTHNAKKFSGEHSFSVWETLRKRHWYLHAQAIKAGKNAEWLKKREESVINLIRRYEPSEPRYRYLPLFSHTEEREEQMRSGMSRDEVAASIKRKQRDAVKEIWKTAGTNELLAFAARTELSQLVGKLFGEIASADVDAELLPGKLRFEADGDYWTIAGYVAGRFGNNGWSWVENLVSIGWTAEQRAMLLVLLPFGQDVWGRLHSFLGEDESLYWRHADVRGINRCDVEAAVSGLLKYGCFHTAAEALSFACLGAELPRADLSQRILSAFVEKRAQDQPNSMATFHFEQMLKAVQQSTEVDPKETARYEWHFFELFDRGLRHDFSPIALNRELANDPKLFCEALELAYLTAKEAKIPQEKRKAKPLSEADSRRTENTWRLLRNWNVVPGVDATGVFNAKRFRKWVKEAFDLARKSDRLEVAKSIFGGVAIYAPKCADFWMPHEIAKLMEMPSNKRMLEGYGSAMMNSHGAIWVDDTMKAEKDLANQYKGKAEQAERFGYFSLAATMRNLANSTISFAQWGIEEDRKRFAMYKGDS